MEKRIWAVVKVDLVFPYHTSFSTLIELVNLWDMKLFIGGTKKPQALIGVQAHKFKMIFGKNPSPGDYNPPDGTEHFIKAVYVVRVKESRLK